MYVNYRIQKIQAPVVLFGKMFSVNQLCVATNIAAIPILYLFGAGSIMFWVIGRFWILVLVFDLTQQDDLANLSIRHLFFNRCVDVCCGIACILLQY